MRLQTLRILMLSAAMLGVPQHVVAQSPSDASLERVGTSIGLTHLPFGARWGSSVFAVVPSASLRLIGNSRASLGVRGRFMLPFAVGTVQAECIPDVPCPSHKSPDYLVSASAEGAVATFNRKLRALVGFGFVSAAGMENVAHSNALAIEGGLEWSFQPGRRVSPTVAFTVQQFTRDIGDVRRMFLPRVGIAF